MAASDLNSFTGVPNAAVGPFTGTAITAPSFAW